MWPPADILRLHRHGTPPVPTLQLKKGVQLYHGTRSAYRFSGFDKQSWFALNKADGYYFAHHEGKPYNGRIKVVTARLKRRVKLVAFPDSANRQDYANAIFWAKAIFGVSFDQIGYRRLPAAFNAVCVFGFDGIYIAREDSNKPSVMICDGRDVQALYEETY